MNAKHLKRERHIRTLTCVQGSKQAKLEEETIKEHSDLTLSFNYVQIKIIIAFLNDTVHKSINFYEIRWSSSGYSLWRIKTAAYVQCDCLFLAYSITNRMALEVLLEHSLLSCQLREEDFLKLLPHGFCHFVKK